MRAGRSPDPKLGAPDPILRNRIRLCIEQVPRKRQAAFRARIGDDGAHPDRDLAERLKMKLNTFHQNFGRARKLMAECLEAHGVSLP